MRYDDRDLSCLDLVAAFPPLLKTGSGGSHVGFPILRPGDLCHGVCCGVCCVVGRRNFCQHALSKLVNSLSWGRKIAPPRAVDKEKTIFHIDLRAYRWNENIWDAIVAANPYHVKHETRDAAYCAAATSCALPFVRGDWFVAAASRPPLYHTVLELPDTDKKLEVLLRVNVAENLRTKQVARAGFNGSGVSANNRLIERHESDLTGGAYWKSYDFAANDGRKNLFAHPLGPAPLGGASAFEHDGGEIIYSLPNGLQAYLLVDAKGKRIDKGPIAIVSDPVQKDRAVVNGISCMSCHSQGMIRKQDEVRAAVEKSRDSFTAAELATILALYPAEERFAALLKEDEERFAKAVKETGAALASKDPIVQLALRFEAELNVDLAAAELGLTKEQFLKGLNASRELGRTLGNLKVAGGTVKRDVWNGTFGGAIKDLGLGAFVPPKALPPDDTAGSTVANSHEKPPPKKKPNAAYIGDWIELEWSFAELTGIGTDIQGNHDEDNNAIHWIVVASKDIRQISLFDSAYNAHFYDADDVSITTLPIRFTPNDSIKKGDKVRATLTLPPASTLKKTKKVVIIAASDGKTGKAPSKKKPTPKPDPHTAAWLGLEWSFAAFTTIGKDITGSHDEDKDAIQWTLEAVKDIPLLGLGGGGGGYLVKAHFYNAAGVELEAKQLDFSKALGVKRGEKVTATLQLPREDILTKTKKVVVKVVKS